MKIFDGRIIAKEIIERLKNLPVPKKIFAAILVGENPASISFLKQKRKVAGKLKIDFRIYKFPRELKNDDLRKEVLKIALLKKVGGVIVQLPLPAHLNRHYILNVIPREKDVDVLGERAIGAFYCGRNPILPPAVGVIKGILNTKSYVLNSKKVAIVGAGFLIGKPIAIWLMNNPEKMRVKELKIFEKRSDLNDLKNYDLVISGVGKAGLIKPEMLKPDAGIIDFGYSIGELQNANNKALISGDFDSERLAVSDSRLVFYTPTPGGTGPILIAKIFENFYKLN